MRSLSICFKFEKKVFFYNSRLIDWFNVCQVHQSCGCEALCYIESVFD